MSWRESTGRQKPNFRASRGGLFGNKEQSHPDKESPPPPYGELLLETKREDLQVSSYDPRITSCSYVASYSWLNRAVPSVMIPGEPPIWNPPVNNRQLEPDKGKYFRDPNAAKYPSYPLEPAVQAILKQCPQFGTNEVDIFTCASILGNLSRFIRGVDQSFRFVMERVGNTVFLLRRENSPTELISDVRGYGHTFPEEYTSWGRALAGSESHQRIIRYDFGGLRFLVRFESDGYIRKEDKAERTVESTDVNSLIGMLRGHSPTVAKDGLHIEEGGCPVPQEDVIDIKTRSEFDFKTRTLKKEINMTDLTPRLWVSQIPTLIVGYHNHGLFEDIRVQSVRGDILQWERDNERSLRKLASLLHELTEYAGTSKTNLEICRSGNGPLEIRRAAGGLEALPSELKVKWIGDNDKGKRVESASRGS
ncbi:hypothetical protein V8E54_001767 [Elaphomyces granulatus]